MALTDEELAKLAQKAMEEDKDLHDVEYYQNHHCIFDGVNAVNSKHLYFHYKNWSVDPVTLEIFIEFLNLTHKNIKHVYLDKNKCNIIVEKLIGEYVQNQRKSQKEKRFRKVPSSKS